MSKYGIHFQSSHFKHPSSFQMPNYCQSHLPVSLYWIYKEFLLTGWNETFSTLVTWKLNHSHILVLFWVILIFFFSTHSCNDGFTHEHVCVFCLAFISSQKKYGKYEVSNITEHETKSVWVCLVAQSCPILCDPMDCSLPSSSIHGDSPGKNTAVGCHALL